jgi:subtilisin family serine protease
MTASSRRWKNRTALVGITALMLAMATQASAAPNDPSRFTARALTPSSTVTAAKSPSGRLAQSDKALLARTDSKPVHVMVKLDYDAAASYRGDIAGLPATSPSVTGKKLSGKTPAEQSYNRYTGTFDGSFRAALAKRVSTARAGQSLRSAYGGIAVTVPANQVKTLLTIDGVTAVQEDRLQQVNTIESPEFIGAPAVWSRVGGQALAGRGVVFADIDSGLWPEHPSFADNPALGNPPPAPSGTPRVCKFGDNPLTAANDPFVCNRKLIGGQPFLATYNNLVGDEVYPDSARDSDGHGTHTTSTAAGNIVEHADPLGVDRGRISGVAPGAAILEYKVCGLEGCFSSDSAAAVQQAILDGANVINFSISGGSQPFSDPVELAFLDAYNAGVFVAASAGNSGPGAGTTDHHGPWVTTVAASTQSREFRSTLTVAGGGQTATFVGTTLTSGVTGALPIVLAQDIPGYDKLCSTPLPAGVVTGKIVACQRGVTGRVQKGFNVKAGGAAAMILYNLPLADVESDNHFLPVIHLADGTSFLAFLTARPAATGSFTAGVKADGRGDVMAAFSSRGPGGQFLKPDITAPGVQILAGNTPTPDEEASGPGGEYYQAIAGTSMSAPAVAGSAVLMKALHPTWTPGAIKSALMTTSKTAVVKEDLTTPADPFDFGAGRVDLTRSGSAPIVFDESTSRMATVGASGLTALDLNLPSVNVPAMPGTVTLSRTAKNVTAQSYDFTVSTKAPTGSTIKVTPSSGSIKAGRSRTFTVTITSNAPSGQYFGEILFRSGARVQTHLPVAFFNKQGDATLTQSCVPPNLTVNQTTTCTVTAQNNALAAASVTVDSAVSNGLSIASATGARVNGRRDTASAGPVVLAAPKDAIPAIAPVADADTPGGGYFDLSTIAAPEPIGDEANLNFTVPDFLYGGKTYGEIGVDSNGYLVVGGSDSATDISYLPQTFPDSTPPNGVLAPYWTDLDGSGSPGISAAVLTDPTGVSSWLVVQWNVHVFGLAAPAGARNMQVWIGLNGTEDITYSYAPDTIGADAPLEAGLTVGAENVSGGAGAQITGPPAGSYVVTTTPGIPGGSLSFRLNLRATRAGPQTLTSTMSTSVVAGITRVVTPVTVTR